MKSINIRGKQIANGQVMICVPLCAQDRSAVLADAQTIVAKGAQMVEWRLDLCQEQWEEETLQQTLTELRERLGSCILLVTIRTAKEGGAFLGSNTHYQQLYRWVMASRQADLIDVEAALPDARIHSLIEEAHRHHMRVIVSSHDFKRTPPKAKMLARMRRMAAYDADLIKLAVMPQDAMDVLALLAVSVQMHKEAKMPIITMSMGALGAISRLSGEVFGSAVTFASAVGSSAPGQLSIEAVVSTLALLHDALEQEKRQKSL